MEVTTDRLLFGRNEKTKLPMASTTKIMTAIVVIEDCDLSETIEIPKAAVGVEGSSVYLKEGEKYTVEELLYGLMLRSGNDCATALALHHSKTVEAFAETMNRRAKEWGAVNTHFVNPHGLPHAEHYTTAEDLARIASHAMKNETFRKIVSTKYYAPRCWTNKNKMLTDYEGANGVKTGYTMQAGRCLVSAAERGGMQLVAVVLNSPEMFERSRELLDEGFRDFKMKKVYGREEYSVPLDAKDKTCALRAEKDLYYPLKEGEQIRTEIELPKKIRLPVKAGEIRGKINIYLENQLIFSENLCTIKDVEKTYIDYLRETAEKYVRQ